MTTLTDFVESTIDVEGVRRMTADGRIVTSIGKTEISRKDFLDGFLRLRQEMEFYQEVLASMEKCWEKEVDKTVE